MSVLEHVGTTFSFEDCCTMIITVIELLYDDHHCDGAAVR